MKKSIIVLFFLLICSGCILQAQEFSNKGKDFWIAYPAHIDGTGSVMGLYITSSINTNVTVQVGTSTNTFAILANQVKRYFIGSGTGFDASSSSVYLDMVDGIKSSAAIRVTSEAPVVVYSHIIRSARSGATLVLPSTVLGTTYVASGINSVGTSPKTGDGTNGGIGQFTVVATQDNTIIEIDLTTSGGTGRSAGQKYTITLPSAGDCYQFQTSSLGDISGTRIKSIASGASGCKPIAVFSSSTWSTLDCASASGGDNLYQQLFPTRSWGKVFVTAPFINRPSDIYRIFLDDITSTVSVQDNGVNQLLGSSNYNTTGRFYFYKTSNPIIITASSPVSVAQFISSQNCKSGCTTSTNDPLCYADPEMVMLNPVEQTLGDITFFSAHSNYVPSGQTSISLHYVNIVIPKSFKNSLKIDDASPKSNFVDIPNSNFAYLQEDLTIASASNPIHRIKADTGFTAIVYGYGRVESYGYNGGTNIIDLNPPITLKNEFSSSNVAYSATCSNTPFKINLSLTYQPKSIKVDFGNASGLNGAVIKTYNSPQFNSSLVSNGKTYYTYELDETYKFATSGKYLIGVATTSDLVQSDGCSNSNEQEITDNIIVNDPPTANFNITSNGCINNQVAFTDASDGIDRPIVKWNWTFSDAATSILQNPNKLFATAGNYTAKLTAITDYGCVASVTKDIKISNKPIAAFTVPASICEKSSISFTDASTIVAGSTANTIAQWRWNLDNGTGVQTVNTNATQNFTYTSWGNKNVYLVAESNTGCISDTFRMPGFKINPVPEVGFILPEVCLADATAPFQDTSKIADGSEAGFTYSWNLNAGVPAIIPAPIPSTSIIKNPNPSYKKSDNYTVSLKLTSNNGCIAALSKSFTVNGSIPIPKFEVEQANPLCSNDSIRIKNLSTVDFGVITRLDIFWDTLNKLIPKIPDENPYINKQYAVKYNNFSAPDSIPFTISLVAFSGNSSACSRSIKKIIYVKNSPAVAFSDIRDICYDAAPRQLNQGSFSSALTASGNYYGKGISAGGLLNPITTGVGNDTLKYLVVNTAGCRDSAFQPLTVWPSPIAKWGVSNPLCEKNNIPFTDSSLANFSNITQHKWDFGDGSTENRNSAAVFTHRFDTAKNYTVALSVVTDSGCISTINTQSIFTKDLPKPAFSLPIICLPDGRGSFTNTSKIADGSADLFSYAWNFGNPNDPTPSLLKVPTHKYSALGPYNVKLKITSKDGCIDSLTRVLNTIYPWPKANFNISAAAICLGDSIKFTDAGNGISSPPNTWRWNFGDGKLSSSQNPTNTFSDSGSFNIRYFFFNGQGCVSDTVSKTIIVHPYPKLILGPKINVLEGGTAAIKPQYIYGSDLSYLWTPPTYLNNPIDSIPKTSPLSDITYRLNLTGIGGCTVTDTIFIKLLLAPLVPNAFSPNGDGINDRWRIQYLESYPGATVQVFNRYGQVVFSSFEYSVNWDGKLNGKPLPIGTYYYIVDPKNGRNKITGSVTIIL
ncbi:MAG: PKD domain-containing protein [Sphingobacteriia bacterium]|nr:MAG: PKD domain-containing protein [Sphingobacteriia bacterium]TAG32033.1 MAG: PKD domain-containing protein [Sphingobacteriia bacterium]